MVKDMEEMNDDESAYAADVKENCNEISLLSQTSADNNDDDMAHQQEDAEVDDDHDDDDAENQSKTMNSALEQPRESQDEEPQSLFDDEKVDSGLPQTVGGQIDKTAFCMLDGVALEDADYQAARIPITCLPATLGRQHVTDDESFISMGKLRILSRQMLRIDYRTKEGILVHTHGDGGNQFSFVKDKIEPKFVGAMPSAEQAFFSLTSLGKNGVLVNGKRLDQGQTMQLTSGDAIKISCYLLYFLLPTETPTQTMQFGGPASPKRKAPTVKKRPAPTTVVSTAMPSVATKQKTTAIAAAATSTHTKKWISVQAELDSVPTEELLVQFVRAIDDGVSDHRRHYAMGSIIAYRAVLACATDARMQREDLEMDGVNRNDVMKWIEDSAVFGLWSEKIQTQIEFKSYMANLTKAMLKAGYERTASAGRNIRWRLPGSAKNTSTPGNAANETVVKKGDKDGANLGGTFRNGDALEESSADTIGRKYSQDATGE